MLALRRSTCMPGWGLNNASQYQVPFCNILYSMHQFFSGEMSMFSLSNEVNKLIKKFKVHKGAVRTVEFDKTGKFLLSGSSDKSFKITDIVSILASLLY